MDYVQQAIAIAPHARGILSAVGGPKGLLGRALGFGPLEMRVGVPGWAWFLIGAGVGGTVVWFQRDRIERVIRR